LAVAKELKLDLPVKPLDAISEDNVTISSPDPNADHDPDVKVSYTQPYSHQGHPLISSGRGIRNRSTPS
jgi:hypothetical protein